MSESKALTPAGVGSVIVSDKASKYIQPYLPEGVSLERVAASAMLAIKNDASGKLAECSMDSLVMAVARIASWGLEIGTTAHLIPFKGRAVPVADYKGLCELMISSKSVRYIEAREVREGDHFEYAFGLEPVLSHKQAGGKRTAAITHVYCIIHLPMSQKTFEVMTAEEVDEIRKTHSKQWKDGPLTAWYAKKTIIRRTAKTLPKSPTLAKMFAVLDTDELNLDEELSPAGEIKPAEPAPALKAGTPAPAPAAAAPMREPGEEAPEF